MKHLVAVFLILGLAGASVFYYFHRNDPALTSALMSARAPILGTDPNLRVEVIPNPSVWSNDIHVVNAGSEAITVRRMVVNDRAGLAFCDKSYNKTLHMGDEIMLPAATQTIEPGLLGNPRINSCGARVVKLDVYLQDGQDLQYTFPN